MSISDVYQVLGSEDNSPYPHGRWKWREKVAYVFSDGLTALMQDTHLTKSDVRVLLALMGRLGWQNRCTCTQAVLAYTLGLSRTQVSKSVQRLTHAGYLLVQRVLGQPGTTITLNPAIMWKGRPWHLAQAREQFSAVWQALHGPQGHVPATGPPAVHETTRREPSPPGESQRGNLRTHSDITRYPPQ